MIHKCKMLQIVTESLFKICCVHRTTGSHTKMISMSFSLNWTTTMAKTTTKTLVCKNCIINMCNVCVCVYILSVHKVTGRHSVLFKTVWLFLNKLSPCLNYFSCKHSPPLHSWHRVSQHLIVLACVKRKVAVYNQCLFVLFNDEL